MINIQPVSAKSTDLRDLIRALDDDLLLRYPSEQIYRLNLDDPQLQDVVFVVAYLNQQPVGCGAIRKLDEQYTELKRFFVHSAYRRQGIAGALLNELEQHAKQTGFTAIRLETGAAQPEALAFYEQNGYIAIERFGEYTDDESSLCYEKKI